MDAEEKALELTKKILREVGYDFDIARLCALAAVDEIILSNPHSNPFNTDVYSTMGYWLDVKNEIEKL